MVAQKEKPENIPLLSRHKNCYKILSSIPSESKSGQRQLPWTCQQINQETVLLSYWDEVLRFTPLETWSFAILISTNHTFNSKCSRKFIINNYVVSWILNNEFIQFRVYSLTQPPLGNSSSLGWSPGRKNPTDPPHTSIWMDAWLPSKSNHES